MLSKPDNKKSILIIDQPGPELDQLIQNLQETRLQVVHIEDSQKACDYCLRNQPAVIITELAFPNFSGIQFFRQIKSNFITSQIPVIVTTKEPQLDDRIKSMQMGIDDYIVKPYHPEEVVARVHILLNEVKSLDKNNTVLSHGFKGNLEEMNVVDIIKAMELGKMSGIIYLNRGFKEGQIFINQGQIIDAFIEGFEPEQALSHMLTWLEGSFWVSLQSIDRNKMINTNNKHILSHGTKMIQKWRNIARQLPPMNTSLKTSDSASDRPVSPIEKQMLNHYHQPKTIMQGIEESKLDDIHALELIKGLLSKGLLVARHAHSNADDPFAKIVFEQLQKEVNQQKETFSDITSYFMRNADNTSQNTEGVFLKPEYSKNTKKPYKVYLSLSDLKRIKNKLSQ